MAITTKNDLKSRFENGDLPSAQDFIDLIDTFVANQSNGTFGEDDRPCRVSDGTNSTEVRDNKIIGLPSTPGAVSYELSASGLRFATGSEYYKFKQIEIDDWDMVTSANYDYTLPSFITKDNVFSVSMLVFDDLGSPYGNPSTADTSEIDATVNSGGTMTLSRVGSGKYDQGIYSSPTNLRIRAIITYNAGI